MDLKAAELLHQDLVKRINEYSDVYYSSGSSLIDDDTFDILVEQLSDLEEEHPELRTADSPTQKVGASSLELFTNIQHEIPMLSLSNLYNEDDLDAWLKTIYNLLETSDVQIVCEVKIDGVAMSFIYKEGKFIQAITRGNGEIGEDVTANILTIEHLPKKLPQPYNLTIRGEVFLPRQKFDAINKKRMANGESLFKNPRNATAGTIRLKNSNMVKSRGLDFHIYDLVSGENRHRHSENLSFLESVGIPVNPYRSLCESKEQILEFCQKWESSKKDLPFDIDGVVIKVDDLKARAHLGMTAKSPRWASAWKFKAQKVKTKLISVENSIGRTGTLTPVANLMPVQLMGTEVKRATLHNYDQIQRLDIHHDDVLFVEKGGDIIPKIVGVDYTQRAMGSLPILAPRSCPICDSSLTKSELEVDLRCENVSCPAVIEGILEHFVSKKCMDIQHFGTAQIGLFLRKHLISRIPDIYRLSGKREALEQLEGFGKKSIDNLINAIEKSKTNDLNRFIHSLGIRHIGEKAAKSLASICKSLNGFMQLTKEPLESLNDFGPVMVESVLNWLENPENQETIQELIALGLDPRPPDVVTPKAFEGTTCVITGTLSTPRNEWKYRLENLGFDVTSAVSKKTKYLLAGENAGSKLDKAKKLGITILNETEMETLILERGE